jgi:hypothetical protein
MKHIKSVRAYHYFNHFNKNNYKITPFYQGKEDDGEYKIMKIEYDGKIELEYKLVTNDKEIDLFISNEFKPNKLIPSEGALLKNSCLTIKIDKKKNTAHIEGISTDMFSCFSHPEFSLINEGKFYLIMTIKFLKKYKDKFKINKITLLDNANINTKKGNFNLSQFKLLTEGLTWYEKYGFKINKEYEKQHQLNKDIIKEQTVDSVDLITIISNIKEKSSGTSIEYLKNIINLLEKNKKENLIKMMNYIFIENKNNYSENLYILINDMILTKIEEKYPKYKEKMKLNQKYFERYKPNNYYMEI